MSTLRTVVAETATPTPFSSPTILRYPQRGFSLANRRIKAPTDESSGGRPGPVLAYVQRRATSRAVPTNNLSGLTKKQAHAADSNERLNTARKARSARNNLGRAPTAKRARADPAPPGTQTTTANDPPSPESTKE